jgi:predicted nucleotidyltransferase
VSLQTDRDAYVQRLEAAPRRILERLSTVEGIRRVSLFGSFAGGRRDLYTDLDLLVVWDTEKSFLERLQYLHGLLDVAVDLDVVCYTPEEFEGMKDRVFLRRALSEEVLVFEKRPA